MTFISLVGSRFFSYLFRKLSSNSVSGNCRMEQQRSLYLQAFADKCDKNARMDAFQKMKLLISTHRSLTQDLFVREVSEDTLYSFQMVNLRAANRQKSGMDMGRRSI